MPRRRDLKGVAGGLLGSFMSRNNDIEGYWAIGKLCKYALASGNPVLKIGIVAWTSTAESPLFQHLESKYQDLFSKLLSSTGIPDNWVACGHIEIAFLDVKPDRANRALIGILTPFRVSAIIRDDLGRNRIAESQSRCWSHDPRRESRSTRHAGRA